jgi:pyrroloquinoline quinone (PQQ) biosynthesis protein C
MTADTDFANALLAAARPQPEAADPFVEAFVSGRWTREEIRRYAVALVAMADGFPRRLSAILSICDAPEVRASLIANLLEEEGVAGYEPGAGLRIAPERRHSTLARRFAVAADASDAEIHATVTEARDSRWFAEAIRCGDWIGAFAYVAVGHESNVPTTFRQIVPPLVERYGFSLDDLVFLTEHYEADERHGNESAHLIARIARTEEARRRALEGSRRGGKAWRAWSRTSLARTADVFA